MAHVVIDGGVDGTFARSTGRDIDALLERDEITRPDDIAAAYVNLHCQPRSASTQELDLRGWPEMMLRLFNNLLAAKLSFQRLR